MKYSTKYIEKLANFLLSLVFLFIFTSCNQIQIERDDRTLGERKKDLRTQDRGLDIEGKLAEEGGGVSKLFGIEPSIGFEGSVIYQVALDKVSFMPLSSVDSASGIIITDWYNIADNNLRLKINIRVTDENLSDDSISISVFKQSFDGQKWVDEGNDPDQALKIKNSILSEARVLQATIDLS